MSLMEKIKEGELTVGSWITLAHPAIAEIMSKAGFDWLAVDLEHSVITIREAEELIRVISLAGVTPLVRLTSNNPDLIKRVMDAGSHGVIVPMVKSAEDAVIAVESVKYPPVGKRGVGLARAQGYGTEFKEYLKTTISGKTTEDLLSWGKNQAYLALGNLLTVCANEKIDSCPMEGFIPEKYDEVLGLKEKNLSSVLVLPVGYRAEDDIMTHQKKVRKNIDEIVIDIS